MEIELPQSRLKRIFTNIINSREKFLKYLTFLLLGEESELIETNQSDLETSVKESMNSDSMDWSLQGIPVFEKLLLAASRYPKRLDSIDKLIEYLKAETAETGEQIVSEDFEALWSVFKSYRENLKGNAK
jgi:hypothetical protein